ncbi:MAG: PD40 domain-containing protein [Nitrospinae bacterium]|nr:PD40 domain-containing protein [Nitrospinota bacterium]
MVLTFAAPIHAEGKKPGKTVFEKDGNIFLKVKGKPVQLTNTGRDFDLALSPDGRWVAFSREIEDKTGECKKKQDDGRRICNPGRLWIMDLERRSERLLLEPREDARDMKEFIGEFSDKFFSPDGKTLFFQTYIRKALDENFHAIHAVDIDGGNERFVVAGATYDVIKQSRDNTWTGHLVVGKYKALFSGNLYAWYWLITPQGKELGPLGANTEHFNHHYKVTYMESGVPDSEDELEAGEAQAEEPKTSKTVFERDGNIFLWIDFKETQVTHAGRDHGPALSPDGRWVAFSREIEDKAEECKKKNDWICATDQLWVVDLETRSERLLLEPREDARDMKDVIGGFENKDFSPDSKTLYFDTPAWAVSDAVHAVDIDGKNERFVTPGSLLRVVKEPLSPEMKNYLVDVLEEDDWRIFPKNGGAPLVWKALKDDVSGYLIVDKNGIRYISSPIPLEGYWEGDDGKYYISKGRTAWRALVSPDGEKKIPLERDG